MTAATGAGAYLLVTALLFGRSDLRTPHTGPRLTRRASVAFGVWKTQAGLDTIRTRDLGAVITVAFGIGAGLAMAFFGAWLPALAVLLSILGFNLLGDALRDILDPRTRRSTT